MSDSLAEILQFTYPLPQTSLEQIREICEEKHFAKGHLIIQNNRLAQNLFLIKKGIVRAYAQADGHEITFWFGKEGDPVISMKNYVENRNAYESVELLEDCVLFQISVKDLRELYLKDIHIANWGRRLAEKELIRAEERQISREFKTARERYTELMQQNPELLRRVSLGNIASYLGITQVSLSRIRAEVR
ncbi:Crp/Fnr family transcriptional regulator [Ravibacter arvi]|uniref:Crp/Fnr family transcriptional regulator n=1 Tax=Ravibacter arvi TaxID=2051041 RepID=A0ABP8LXM5_9BACT